MLIELIEIDREIVFLFGDEYFIFDEEVIDFVIFEVIEFDEFFWLELLIFGREYLNNVDKDIFGILDLG